MKIINLKFYFDFFNNYKNDFIDYINFSYINDKNIFRFYYKYIFLF